MKLHNSLAILLFIAMLALAMLACGGDYAGYPTPDAAATGEATYLWLTAEAATPIR